jgi:hypothetical protein
MGQLGKYTTYVGGGAKASHTLLSKLYPNSPLAAPLSNGDETKAQQIVQAIAVSNPGPLPNGGGIQPASNFQAGDLGMFPTGVNLAYARSPDVSKVKWTNPGDPANGYIPDISSPSAGPGHTEGTDKTSDPTGTIPQIQQDSTNSDAAGQNLRNPVLDGPAIDAVNTIGTPLKLGDSGGNV